MSCGGALTHFSCKLGLKKIFHRPGGGAGAPTAPPWLRLSQVNNISGGHIPVDLHTRARAELVLVILLQCDKTCDVGTQYREVVCIVRRGDRKIIIPDHQCESETKPDTSQSCDNGACDGLQWITSQWSGVSTAASAAFRTVLHAFC